MNFLKVTAIAPFIFLLGCATSPDELPATYVSSLKYSKYDCDQIIMEMDNVGRRTGEIYARLDKKASTDSAQMGIGLLLFWPTLFALDGDGPDAAEYSRLKGEYQALESATVSKKCAMANLPPSPEEIAAEFKRKKEFEAKQKQKKDSESTVDGEV